MTDGSPLLLDDIVRAHARIAATPGRNEKIRLLSEVLARAGSIELSPTIALLSGSPRQGRIGVGYRTVSELRTGPAPARPTLTVAEIDEALEAIARTSGPGSTARRTSKLSDLFARATEPERTFLGRVLTGELRQGAGGGLMLEAVALAIDVPPDELRAARMRVGTLQEAVAHFRDSGPSRGPAAPRPAPTIEVFRPVRPMLAGSAPSLTAALARTGPALVEAKADGARIQLHREGREVRVFTRALNDVTRAVPEIVEMARGLPSDRFVIDGEAIAWSDAGPLPFQETSKRIGADGASARARRTRPLRAFLFDCLLEGGAELVDFPLGERRQVLENLVDPEHRLPGWELDPDPEIDGSDLLAQVVDVGWEGLMVKSLGSTYRAGRRGAAWLKVKRAWALDLVVLAAEWGSGRRTGKLSNLHLGARDEESGTFVMLGKTFKGLTDEMLAWQTEALRAIATHEERHVVWVRPELVVEIAFDGVQKSSRYPAGMALRFARVKGYRTDKPSAEADTLATVRRIFEESRPPEPPAEQTDLFGGGA